MEDPARESTLYRDIFEASQDPIMVHDAQTGEILQANPAAGSMLGLDREEVVGMHVGEFSPPGFTTEDANRLIQQAVEDGQNQIEWTVRGPEGDRRWVEVLLERATIDQETRVVAFIRDVTAHKTAEQRYRTERDMLDRLLDISPVGIVIHDADGEIRKTNERAEKILGVDRKQLIGSAADPDEITVLTVGGDPIDAKERPFETVVRTGEAINDQELTIEQPDGERVVVSVSASPLFADGDISRVVVSISDITERRERESQHKERNEQLRTLVDNLPVVVFTLNPDGVFTHSTGKGLDALGVEPGDFEGISVYDVYGEYEDITDAADRALAGEEVRVTQDVDGLVFETWYQPVFDSDGDLVQVVGVARDITDIKRHEARLEQLGDATRDLLYARSERAVADRVTAIAQSVIDRPIAAMWSYEEADDTLYPIGATAAATAFGGADVTENLPAMGPDTDEKHIFETGETTMVEDYQTLSNPSAPEVPLRTLLCLPLADHGMLCIGSDTVEELADTERFLLDILASTATAALDRVQKEAEIESQRDELARSNEALQQFAYIASHDLQEPLRMVSSYIGLLEAEYGDEFDEEAREYMHYATDGADRMKAMVDGLLSYSRVQTQGTSFEEVEATEVLEATLQELSLFLSEADTSVEYDTLPRVAADRDQLRQVFQNLLKNAVKHGEAETIEVTASEQDGRIRFAVADDGVGIPADQQDQIFGIFEQGHSAEGGSGIGLAVCERIVERHDGDIWVESDPEAGTTFYFTAPRYSEDETQ